MGWLDAASLEFRKALRLASDRLELPAGTSHIISDDPTGGLTGIVSGRIDLHMPRAREGRTLVHAFAPGWWIGDLSVVSGKSRRFDHVAAVPSVILRLSKVEFQKLCRQHPDAWPCFAFMIAENMRVAIDGVEEHRTDDPTNRIAKTIKRLLYTGKSWRDRLPISQGDLASIANLSRRRTNEALAALEKQGFIKRYYKGLEILDLQALQDQN